VSRRAPLARTGSGASAACVAAPDPIAFHSRSAPQQPFVLAAVRGSERPARLDGAHARGGEQRVTQFRQPTRLGIVKTAIKSATFRL
jgi:hypothetical protein